MEALTNLFATFHFIRPLWFWAAVPLIMVCLFLWQQRLSSRSWEAVIEPQLLPHLLIGTSTRKQRWPILAVFILGLGLIIALAGPAWKQLPQPVYKPQSALVIALDLSRSMDVRDVKPTRLERARYKISDILKQRTEGQTALIAYAADAFTVSPLTDDARTIDALLASLSTDIMPAQGSRIDKALQKAYSLFKNASLTQGHILLITDGVDREQQQAFKENQNNSYPISILGIGTQEGAPITLAGGDFLKDQRGQIVIPKLDSTALQSFASQHGGRFSQLSADDKDIQYLLAGMDVKRHADQAEQTEIKADIWQEEGPWVLLFLLPFIALVFRRGILVVLVAIGLNLPQPVEAIEYHQLWQQLWQNDNQRASKKFEREQAAEAAELFDDPQWKAAAHYKAGDYEKAIEQLRSLDNTEAHYNRGNALAKLGQLDQAIQAYEQVLAYDPQHEDAKYNKELIEKQKQQQQEQQNSDQNQQSESNQEKQNQEQQGQQQENQDQATNESADSDPQQQNTEQATESDQVSEQAEEPQPSQQTSESEHEQQADTETLSKTEETEQDEETASEQKTQPELTQQELSQQAREKWLRRIPDNPGGLLRRKFEYQYQQQPHADEKQAW